jgi:hypothetical protein
MARVLFTGTGKLYWVADPTQAGTVVTLAAPTATQVNTGTNVTSLLRRDGLARPQSGNTIDISDASSLFNKTGLGTFGGDKVTVQFYRDKITGSDIAWPLLAQGSYGFFIILPFGTAGGSPAAGDRCEVWQVAVANRSMSNIADNDAQRFSCDLAVIQPPNDNATLV